MSEDRGPIIQTRPKSEISEVCLPDSHPTKAEIQAVYAYYLAKRGLTEGQYRLTAKRRQKIAARLGEYEPSDGVAACKAAIDSCLSDGWKERGNFCDLAEHIFRSEEQMEKWVNRGASK